jgi:Fe2+ or Zn2+ uptake regulation protein
MYGDNRRIERDLYDASLGLSECRVLLAAMILQRLGQSITSESVHNVTGMNLPHIRNTLKVLEVKGLLECVNSPRILALYAPQPEE